MGWFDELRGSLARTKAESGHPVLKFLEPDETPRWIMPATGGFHPFTLLVLGIAAIGGILLTETLPFVQVLLISTVVFLAVAMLTMTRYRLLVINEFEVVLLRTRALRTGTPVERLGTYDRINPFEVRGSMWGQIVVGEEKLWIHRRFHSTLHEADEALNQLRVSGTRDYSADAAAGGSKVDPSEDSSGNSTDKPSGGPTGKPTRKSSKRAAEATSTIHRANRAKKRVKYAKRGRQKR